MDTIGTAYQSVKESLSERHIPNASHEARYLIEHACDVSMADIISRPEKSLNKTQQQALVGMVGQRLDGIPLSRILGRREFWSIPFSLNEATLDPRADSETLVEAVLEEVERDKPVRVLDLGTGTGCLLLALLSELPQGMGVGVDVQDAAVAAAKKNAQALGLYDRASFQMSDWYSDIEGCFDVIVSNPPYIRSTEIESLDDAVKRFDPIQALDGGNDGLDAYKKIIPQAYERLNPHGILAVEIGYDQAGDVKRLMESSGFVNTRIKKDLGSLDRVVIARRGEK